jgi:hypothetical protein
MPPKKPTTPSPPAPSAEYNPLAYDVLTRNIVDELMTRGPYALPLQQPFPGAGVYAIFYRGDLPLYRPVRSPDARWPIYVGKAIPAGSRKALVDKTRIGRELFNRLSEHAESIQAAGNLAIGDFCCRYLVVAPLWIPMAERLLIESFHPVWNGALDGFGNHDPGGRRSNQWTSPWDTVHTGRPWANKLARQHTVTEAERSVREFLAEHRPGRSMPPLPLETLDRELAEGTGPYDPEAKPRD